MVWTALLIATCLQSPGGSEEVKPKPKVRVVRPVTPPASQSSGGSGSGAREPAIPSMRVDSVPTANGGRPSRFVANLTIPRPRPRTESLPTYRVAVRMKNGRRFSGLVIRDPRFHAVVYQGEHHKEAIYQDESDFKLSYVDGLDGELRLPWWRIARLEVRDVLDESGLLEFESAQFAARVTRRSDVARAMQGDPSGELAEGAAPGTAEGPTSADASKPGKDSASAPDPDLTGLLAQFPPKEGWGEERKRQIEWRRTVVGVFPDEQEEQFLENYDLWLTEYEVWAAEQEVEDTVDAKALEAKKAEVKMLQEKLEKSASNAGKAPTTGKPSTKPVTPSGAPTSGDAKGKSGPAPAPAVPAKKPPVKKD